MCHQAGEWTVTRHIGVNQDAPLQGGGAVRNGHR